jgi:hypothetical protein
VASLGFGVGGDDRSGKGAADPPGGGHLVREAGAESGLVRQFDPDRLDRDQPAGRGPPQKHLAHRPGT